MATNFEFVFSWHSKFIEVPNFLGGPDVLSASGFLVLAENIWKYQGNDVSQINQNLYITPKI